MFQSSFRRNATPTSDSDAMDAAMIAHDIRAALQGVVGGVASFERANLTAALAGQVDAIVASSRLLENLIGLVLGDSTDLEPDHGEVDLGEFFAFLLHRWAGEALAKGIDLGIESGAGLPRGVHLQHMPLTRMLGNLLSNAIQHSAGGRVTLLAERSGRGDLVLRVRDSGPGYPADVLEAHGVGRSAEPPRPGAVHGLGLHIVRRLASETGLTLRLANRPEGGGEASLRIPGRLLIDDAATQAAAPEGAEGTQDGADLSGLRLLLAEDNPTNQMVAEQMLRALGAEVVVASDGVEALERFEAGRFDMVVVDIEMPRLSGLDVIRAIRARQDGRALTPIVALTAYALREHRDQIARAGANGMISKPITSIEVLGRGLAEHRGGGVPGQADPSAEEAAADPMAHVAAVDRDVYESLLAAIGVEMTGELLEKVEADIESARVELAGALDPVTPGPLRAASHILISVAGAVGATRLQTRARALNSAAHDGNGPDLVDLTRAVIAEIETALGFVRSERAKL